MNCPNCGNDIRDVGLSYDYNTVPMEGRDFDIGVWTCNECNTVIHLNTE